MLSPLRPGSIFDMLNAKSKKHTLESREQGGRGQGRTGLKGGNLLLPLSCCLLRALLLPTQSQDSLFRCPMRTCPIPNSHLKILVATVGK
ncbi:MAG: hypothetical protein F6J93_02405 [Oscillatoria sp. SIO1A7]|nr:hypothetical protein [Oscillatoria sp. SIO1A7]